MNDNRVKHHGRYERELPTVPSHVPGEEIILDILLAPPRDTHSEGVFFEKLIRRIHDPLESGPYMYTDIGGTGISLNPADDCTKDPLYEGTGLENLQIRKSENISAGFMEFMFEDRTTRDWVGAGELTPMDLLNSYVRSDLDFPVGWDMRIVEQDKNKIYFNFVYYDIRKDKLVSLKPLGISKKFMLSHSYEDIVDTFETIFEQYSEDYTEYINEEMQGEGFDYRKMEEETMVANESFVAGSITISFNDFAFDIGLDKWKALDLWKDFADSYNEGIPYKENLKNWKERNKEMLPENEDVVKDIFSSKKTGQDFDTSQGAPKNEESESTETSNQTPDEDTPVIDEDFFKEEVDPGKSGMDSIGPEKGVPPKEKIPVEIDIIDQFTFMDKEEYYKWVNKREEAESSGDTIALDHINSEIKNLIQKYQQEPSEINKQTDMVSFVKHESVDYLPLMRKLKTHTMLDRDDYTKLVSSLDEKLFELKKFLKLRILNASWYNYQKIDDEERVDVSIHLAGTKTSGKNIIIRMIKKGQKISVLPYFWDSLGRKYPFDDVGIKKLFNYQDTSRKVLDPFKEE